MLLSLDLRESDRVIGGRTGVSLREAGVFCRDSTRWFLDTDRGVIGGNGGVSDFPFEGPGSCDIMVLLESCFFTCNGITKRRYQNEAIDVLLKEREFECIYSV